MKLNDKELRLFTKYLILCLTHFDIFKQRYKYNKRSKEKVLNILNDVDGDVNKIIY